MSAFVHTHAHTYYSMLDGISSPMQYAERCYQLGYPAMAATEHGHMGSVPDMYFAFKQYGLKSIAGCEIYYNDWEPIRQKLTSEGHKIRSVEWRMQNYEIAQRINRNRHLTVLCKSQKGVENLIKLTTQAYNTGLYGLGTKQYNRIWFEKLCEYKEGLIVLSGCLNGPVSHELRTKFIKNKEGEIIRERSKQERLNAAVEYIKKFKKAFGEDYYIELQMPGVEDDDIVFRHLISLADAFKLKTVLANDCHYLNRKDYQLQKIMMAIEQETTVDSPDLFHVNSDEQYMKTREELYDRFKNNSYSTGIDNDAFQKMCDNTLEIADKCDYLSFDSSPKIPIINDSDNMLRKLVAKRIKELQLDKIDKKFIIDGKAVTYVEQAKLELNRFIDKGFSSYFCIIREIINYGKEQGYPFSARGSASGSLVCYLLGIHSIDPMKWGLSFDRFLSPSRGGYRLNLTME
jgi:DNA polymerase-3 subunit alpha